MTWSHHGAGLGRIHVREGWLIQRGAAFGSSPLWNPLWLCFYMAMWLCSYAAMWLLGYVAKWLCAYVAMRLCGHVAILNFVRLARSVGAY